MTRRTAISILAIVLLGLCLTDRARAGGTEPGEDTGGAEIPDGAILVEDDLYMVPVGQDEDGSMQYTAFSPTKAVIMVIQ